MQSNVTPQLQPTEYEASVKERQHYSVANHDYSFVLCRQSKDFNTDKRISITKLQIITNFKLKMEKRKKWRYLIHEDRYKQFTKTSYNPRLKKSNEMKQYADIYLLLNYCTSFGHPPHPSSVAHKTVVAASGTDHTIWGASFIKRDQIRNDIYLLLNYCTCFGRPSRPSSGVHKNLVSASGTDHTICKVPNQSLFGHVWGSLFPG